MKRRCHHRKIDRDLEQLNQNLNTIIQNQNELYCKLEQLYAIVTSLDSLPMQKSFLFFELFLNLPALHVKPLIPRMAH